MNATNGAHGAGRADARSLPPSVADRLAAATLLARLNAVADKPDYVMRQTLAECLRDYRVANEIAAHAAIEEMRGGLRLTFNVMKKAGALMAFLSDNVGSTADWPVKIKTDNTADADTLCRLLTELDQSLGKRTPKAEVKS